MSAFEEDYRKMSLRHYQNCLMGCTEVMISERKQEDEWNSWMEIQVLLLMSCRTRQWSGHTDAGRGSTATRRGSNTWRTAITRLKS